MQLSYFPVAFLVKNLVAQRGCILWMARLFRQEISKISVYNVSLLLKFFC